MIRGNYSQSSVSFRAISFRQALVVGADAVEVLAGEADAVAVVASEAVAAVADSAAAAVVDFEAAEAVDFEAAVGSGEVAASAEAAVVHLKRDFDPINSAYNTSIVLIRILPFCKLIILQCIRCILYLDGTY